MNYLKAYQQLKVRVQMVRDSQSMPEIIVGSLDALYLILKDEVNKWDREKFLSIMLNNRKQIIAIEEVSVGSLDFAIVHPREVFKSAILANANGIILVHNHPSQDLTPSQEDKQVTNTINSAGQILGIELVDHLIITQDGYTSWAENWIQRNEFDECPF